MVEQFKVKNREELVATRVSPEEPQLDVALDKIVQKMDEAELANETNENNAKETRGKEMEYAKDLREMACYILGKLQNKNQRKVAQLEKREEVRDRTLSM